MEAFDVALLRKKTLLQKFFPRSKLYPLKWWRCGELTVAYGKAVVIDVGISSSDGWKIVVSHFWNMEYYITINTTIRLLFFCLHFFTYVISSCTFLFPDVSLSSISLLVTFFFLNVHSQDEIYSIIYFSTINWLSLVARKTCRRLKVPIILSFSFLVKSSPFISEPDLLKQLHFIRKIIVYLFFYLKPMPFKDLKNFFLTYWE